MKCRSVFRELEAKDLFLCTVDRIPTEPFSTSVSQKGVIRILLKMKFAVMRSLACFVQ